MLINISKINKGEFKWITDTFLGSEIPERLKSDQDFISHCHNENGEYYYPATYKIGNGIYTTHLLEEVLKTYFGVDNVKPYDYDADPDVYGTADDIDQILENQDHKNWFINHKNKYILGVDMINKIDQPARDGFRKHKWGPYIGNKSKGFEYLYDEPDMNHIIIYHFYRILNN